MSALMYVTRTGRRHSNGCELLRNQLWVDGRPIAECNVVSGWPTVQNFRTKGEARIGQLEPLPEGQYELGPVEWAGGKGNWSVLFPRIWSAIWIAIDPDRAIGFHLDSNNDGTAACLGTEDNATLERIAYWREHYQADTLIADWGYGTVEGPRESGTGPPKVAHMKAWAHPGGARARQDGKDVELVAQLVIRGGKAYLTIAGGRQHELLSLTLDSSFRL